MRTDVLGRPTRGLGGRRAQSLGRTRPRRRGRLHRRAFSEAVTWLYDPPQQRDEAVAIFPQNLPNVPGRAPRRAYGVAALRRAAAFQKKAHIDLDGVAHRSAAALEVAEPRRT